MRQFVWALYYCRFCSCSCSCSCSQADWFDTFQHGYNCTSVSRAKGSTKVCAERNSGSRSYSAACSHQSRSIFENVACDIMNALCTTEVYYRYMRLSVLWSSPLVGGHASCHHVTCKTIDVEHNSTRISAKTRSFAFRQTWPSDQNEGRKQMVATLWESKRLLRTAPRCFPV